MSFETNSQKVPTGGTPDGTVESENTNTAGSENLQRHLSNRHIQLIAIGGAIGTGLFMGSGKTIHLAGPSVLLVYLIIGLVLFLVMRAMGELLLSNLKYGSFTDFANDLLGPLAGFLTGWTYWFCWIVTAIAEVIAITSYAHFWWPSLASWIPALVTVSTLFILNSLTVKAFGEIEFWFALVKVIAILALIITGLVMVTIGFTAPDGTPAAISHLWDHGGFFPNGSAGFIAGFQIAIFAFIGIELVGTTAAETSNPVKTLPKAINSIPFRILLFYVGALTAIMIVTPWDRVSPEASPFVTVFSLVGLTASASFVNAIVLSSAGSSCNSGIYSTSRMLYGLANIGSAPKFAKKLSSRMIPRNALTVSAVFLLSSIALLYTGNSVVQAFTMVTTVASLLIMFIWTTIVVAYVAYCVRRPQLRSHSVFKLPGGLFSCGVVFIFMAFLLWALAQEHDTFEAMGFALVWFAALGVAYAIMRRSPAMAARIKDAKISLSEDRKAAKIWREGRK